MSFPSGGPPQPQPPMGLPGAPYGSLGPPSGQAWLSAMPDGAALPGMPPGMTGGMAGMGAGVGGAAPAWTPSLLPQFVPVNSGAPTAAAVQQVFQTFGQIHEVHLMAPSAKTGDRCAFVSFLSTAAAQSAVEQLNGRFQMPPSPRTIVVQLAKESNKRPRA